MEQFGNDLCVARKISFRPLRHAFAAPADENELRKACVGIPDLNERELNTAIRELIDEVDKIALYPMLAF